MQRVRSRVEGQEEGGGSRTSRVKLKWRVQGQRSDGRAWRVTDASTHPSWSTRDQKSGTGSEGERERGSVERERLRWESERAEANWQGPRRGKEAYSAKTKTRNQLFSTIDESQCVYPSQYSDTSALAAWKDESVSHFSEVITRHAALITPQVSRFFRVTVTGSRSEVGHSTPRASDSADILLSESDADLPFRDSVTVTPGPTRRGRGRSGWAPDLIEAYVTWQPSSLEQD
eukprot:942818-Rhodomonas_salina.1